MVGYFRRFFKNYIFEMVKYMVPDKSIFDLFDRKKQLNQNSKQLNQNSNKRPDQTELRPKSL